MVTPYGTILLQINITHTHTHIIIFIIIINNKLVRLRANNFVYIVRLYWLEKNIFS